MKLRTKKTEKWVAITDIEGNAAEFLITSINTKEGILSLDKYLKTDDSKNDSKFISSYQFKVDKFVSHVKDWKGIEDEDGNPLECNRKNKELLCEFNMQVVDLILTKIEELSAVEVKTKEAHEKN
jgi:hypothetical protein